VELFFPRVKPGGLSNLEDAPLWRNNGRSHLATEVLTAAHQTNGTWRDLRYGMTRRRRMAEAFCWGKTLYARRSPDRTDVRLGRKPYTELIVREARICRTRAASGIRPERPDPRCKIIISWADRSERRDRHSRQSMELVPKNTPG